LNTLLKRESYASEWMSRVVSFLHFILPPSFFFPMARFFRRVVGLCLPMASSSEPSSKLSFPTSLRDFGYAFNKAGQLRQLEKDGTTISDRPFEFEVKPGDRAHNQAHYEAMGEVITDEVYNILVTEGGLERKEVVFEAGNKNGPRSFVFVSPGFQEKERLQVLIHGSGVVRAGQWTRKLIMNEDLDHGSVLPFLREAKEKDWGVCVLNTNLNDIDGESIEGSESPEEHGETVWQTMIAPAKASKVVVIAHSYGGIVAMHLASTFGEEWVKRVAGLLLTDSVHGRLTGNPATDSHLIKIGQNWVSSEDPVGTPISSVYVRKGGIPLVSAGHSKHEWTTWAACNQIFEVIQKIKEGEPWKAEAKRMSVEDQKIDKEDL